MDLRFLCNRSSSIARLWKSFNTIKVLYTANTLDAKIATNSSTSFKMMLSPHTFGSTLELLKGLQKRDFKVKNSESLQSKKICVERVQCFLHKSQC